MSRLTLGALIALTASQAAGCIIHDDTPNEVGSITANWQLRNVGSNQLAPCPPGFDTAALYSQEVDANGNDVGQPVIDLFRCDDGTGTSAPLGPTTYVSWIEITNSNNTAIYAKSLSAFVDLAIEDKTFNAQIFLNGGYFQFDWDLEGEVTHNPYQCTTIPGINTSGVEITATLAGSTFAYDDIYPCENYTAVTPELIEGTYNVAISALRAPDDASIGRTSIDGLPITGPNHVTIVTEPGKVGPVTIPIDNL